MTLFITLCVIVKGVLKSSTLYYRLNHGGVYFNKLALLISVNFHYKNNDYFCLNKCEIDLFNTHFVVSKVVVSINRQYKGANATLTLTG